MIKNGYKLAEKFTRAINLSELGVMYPTAISFLAFPECGDEFALFSETHLIAVKKGKIVSKVHMPVWKFTGVGQELLNLIEKPLDDEYAELICRYFVQQKGEATIGKIIEHLPDGKVSYTPVRDITINEPADMEAT